jgi:hypothetical protein
LLSCWQTQATPPLQLLMLSLSGEPGQLLSEVALLTVPACCMQAGLNSLPVSIMRCY